MPVEIIPKKRQPLPPWLNTLFYSLIAIIIVSVLTYFLIGYLQKRSLETIQRLEQEIEEEKTPQMISKEKEVLTEAQKIDDFVVLVENHTFPSKIFGLLEKTVHPQVYYSQINLNPGENLAVLSGVAQTFSALGQQIYLLRNEPVLKKVVLSSVSLGKSGDVNFSLSLFFNPSFFK